jgi:prolyl oligopeptidase
MNDKRPGYPETRIESVNDLLHGIAVSDPYRWLEDASSEEVRAWVERQNAFTKNWLDAVPGRDQIAARLGALLEIGSIGTPAPVRGRYFHARREGRQNQAILYVREGLQGTDHVLLDVNVLSAEGTTALDWWYPSRDGQLLAHGLSQHGSEQSTLHVRDVTTGVDLPDRIERTRACSLSWLIDNSGFYYTRYPAPGSVSAGEESYHRHVFLHRLGDDTSEDIPIFGDGRPMEDWPEVRLSPDGRWLVVTVSKGWSRSEVYFKDLAQPDSGWVALVEKSEALYHVVARADRFYLHTNEGAPRYRLFAVNPQRPERECWNEILPETGDVLEGVAAVGEVLVADYMHRASSRLRLFDRLGSPLHEIPLPALGTVAGLGAEWDGHELLFGFQSFTLPPSIYHLDLRGVGSAVPDSSVRPAQPDRQGPTLWDRVEADIPFDDYALEQTSCSSNDGTPISLFLAHRKGMARDGNIPTLLYGYGGFNISLTPSFAASRFLFLENGGLLAIANLRGGGENGESWHQAGMLDKKQNVFDDFIAAAEWLIAEKWTSPRRLAIQGGSNGGLLVGGALTQRPDLFQAVVCQVPLLDMLRYHRFLLARLWIPEYGSSDDPEQFHWLHAYSPYHHVRDGVVYPAVLLATAESDTRVDAMHSRKMAARLQAASSSGKPILLRLETKAGHGAGKPRAKVLEELTDVWSFVFSQLGMDEYNHPDPANGVSLDSV